MILFATVIVCAIVASILIFHRTLERQRWYTLIKRWILVHVIQSKSAASSFAKQRLLRNKVPERKINCLVSMTTTPTRIKELPQILQILQNLPIGIHINLPFLFRNRESYAQEDIQALAQVPGVSIFYGGPDTGPSMKILPTLQRILHKETFMPDVDYVVTLDDDHFQDPKLFFSQERLFESFRGVGAGMVMHQSSLPVPFGVSSVAFHKDVLTQNFVDRLSEQTLMEGCHYHDDMCIAQVLQDLNVPIEKISVRRTPTQNSFHEEALWFIDPAKDVHCWKSIQKKIKN